VDHPAVKHIAPKEKPGNKIFVTEEELKKFADYDLKDKPNLDRVRDLFILQCATGLRVSDLMRLGKQHIHGDFILLRAFKNRSDLRIPVVPQIQEIMKKYDFKIPSISSDTYNYYLKELAKDVIPKSTVEITEERNNQKIHKTALKHDVLSSHAAVRTFITLSAQRGMPVSSIAKITGKTVAVLLRNYLGLDESQAARDMIKYWGDVKMKIA
jgi:integrase